MNIGISKVHMGLDITNTSKVKEEQRSLGLILGEKKYEGINVGVSKIHMESYGVGYYKQ